MKCEHCGGNLSLNDKYCPHCGCINEQARRHVEDMERYEGEFEQTKDEVYAHTRRFTQVSVRIVIIVVLFAVILVLVMIGQNISSLQYNYERARAEGRFDEYSKVLDQMLADGDYLGFNYYIEAHNIATYDGKYEKYAKIRNASVQYESIYREIMEINRPSDYNVGKEEDMVDELAEDLDYYYESITRSYEYYEIDEALTDRTIAEITENIEALLVGYCGLNADEASSMAQLTNARRSMLLEERVLPIVTEKTAQATKEQEQ